MATFTAPCSAADSDIPVARLILPIMLSPTIIMPRLTETSLIRCFFCRCAHTKGHGYALCRLQIASPLVFSGFELSSATHSRIPAHPKNLLHRKVLLNPTGADGPWVTIVRFCLNLALLQQVRPDLRSTSILLNDLDFFVTQILLGFCVIIINQSTLGLHVVFRNN